MDANSRLDSCKPIRSRHIEGCTATRCSPPRDARFCARRRSLPGYAAMFLSAQKKGFFFEKRNQKPFAAAPWQPDAPLRETPRVKVFWFFFSKKNTFCFSVL
jgi:hypothetical protein